MLFSAGVAHAGPSPNQQGQTYGEASSKLGGLGYAVKVAATVGDGLPQDKCIVVGQRDSKSAFSNDISAVLVSLDCNAAVASGINSGRSAGSPEGRKAKEDAANKAWRETPDGQQWCISTKKQHPDWFPLPGC
jgi:hypothetical protein